MIMDTPGDRQAFATTTVGLERLILGVHASLSQRYIYHLIRRSYGLESNHCSLVCDCC